MAGSIFDVRRAEPSQQQFMVTPPLDMHQAESSRQHVRALNTHFASWVVNTVEEIIPMSVGTMASTIT